MANKAQAAAPANNPWSDLSPVEVPTGNFMKFKKLFDGIAGTIIDMQLELENKKFGRKEDRLTFLVDHGFYHEGDEKIEFDTGSEIVVTLPYNPKAAVGKKIRKLKLGQNVAMVFTELVDTGQPQPFKNIEVYDLGTVNEEWVKGNAPATAEDAKKIFGGEVV